MKDVIVVFKIFHMWKIDKVAMVFSEGTEINFYLIFTFSDQQKYFSITYSQ